MEIRPLDLSRDDMITRALEIHRAAFPGVPGLEHQLLHNSRNAPLGSVFFGAFEDERLIGLNGFVRHSVVTPNGPDVVFQSCSTATDPGFRGRGVFSSIIHHAQSALRDSGLSIVGFPNENSTRIFVGSLGFEAVPLTQVFVPGPLMPRVCSRWLRLMERASGLIRFDQDELFSWKNAGATLEVHNFGPVGVWGRPYRTRQSPLPLTFMSVGGISSWACDASSRAPGLFRRPAAYVFLTAPGSVVDRASSIAAMRRSARIFIHFPLRREAKNADFEVCAGLADFY